MESAITEGLRGADLRRARGWLTSSEEERRQRGVDNARRSKTASISRLKAKGLCLSCWREPAEPDRGLCLRCGIRHSRYAKAVRDKHRAAGACPTCGSVLAEDYEFALCPRCKDRARASTRVGRPVSKRQERLDKGLCGMCGEPSRFELCPACSTGLQPDVRVYVDPGLQLDLQVLFECIDRLPWKQRSVIRGRILELKQYYDLGEEAGRTMAWAQMAFQLGVAKLVAALQQRGRGSFRREIRLALEIQPYDYK